MRWYSQLCCRRVERLRSGEGESAGQIGCPILMTRKYDALSFDSPSGRLGGKHKVNVTDAKCRGELVDSDDCRIASATFQAADVLLAKARGFRKLLLR